jgi:hypothetical protein
MEMDRLKPARLEMNKTLDTDYAAQWFKGLSENQGLGDGRPFK